MIEGTETATVGLDLSRSQGERWGQCGTLVIYSYIVTVSECGYNFKQ